MTMCLMQRLPGLLLLSALGLVAMPTHAGSELLSLLKVLRDNGTITQDQYERLRVEAMGVQKPAAEEVQQQAAVDEEPKIQAEKKRPDRYTVETDGGIRVKRDDGAFEFELGGVVMTDGAFHDSDETKMGDDTELRRARLAMKGRLFTDWGFSAEYDFAGNKAEIKDTFLAYHGFDPVGIQVGHFKEPFSLEDQTSSRYITFMERALPVDAFAPGRKIGASVATSGKMWSAAGGVFGEGIDDDRDSGDDAGWGAAARLTFAPLHKKRKAVHLGGSLEFRQPDDENEVEFKAGPESKVSGVELVDTGRISEVDHTYKYGLEAASVFGPFSVQGEYIYTEVERDRGLRDLDFDGWYAYASWLMTGESRPYSVSGGDFKRIKPKRKFGAWELGLRFSSIDLEDEDVTGGKQDNITLGLNWYVNPNVRFMANYIWADADPNDRGEKDEPQAFQVRAQVDY